MSQSNDISRIRNGAMTVLCAAGLFVSIASRAFCQQPETMAPPIQMNSESTSGVSSVFNWQEVPQNQNVPIERAVFDQGGYQLFDTSGETIVVPFKNDNLYVMEFAVSDDGSTYFVNTGSEPVLYLPEDGYLSNASDSGGHWYPFTRQWHPSEPVFIGIAPSWSAYAGMGWYPNMAYYGGYWSQRPYIAGGVDFVSSGLSIQIGGAQFGGWADYSNYYGSHPAPYGVTIVNQNAYRWGGHGWHQYAGANHPFNGTGQAFIYQQRTMSHATPSNGFRGAAPMAHQQFRGAAVQNNPVSHRPSHEFQGSMNGSQASHAFRGASNSGSQDRSQHSAAPSHAAAAHGFSGAQSSSRSHSQQPGH